ncbi:MAG: TerB family tellurite resistance protein [Pseudomonadota bacterium]
MFARILASLTADAPAPLDKDDSQLALAALMVRIARADGSYDADEVAMIDQMLVQHFGLSASAAVAKRIEAEAVETEAPDTVRFTRAIKEAVDYEDRFGVVKALWSVVLADGVRDDDEDAQMRLISNLLGINDRDSALARQAAER